MDARQMGLWTHAEPTRLQLRELPLVEQPLYRLQRVGPTALSNAELIELILGAAESLGRDVLARFGDLGSLARANLAELAEVRGLGTASGARIQAALELGRRLAALPASEAVQIRTPADAANLLLPTMSLLEQETLRVLVLDTRNRLLADVLIYQGWCAA